MTRTPDASDEPTDAQVSVFMDAQDANEFHWMAEGRRPLRAASVRAGLRAVLSALGPGPEPIQRAPEAAPPSIADMAPGTMCDANGCSARPAWISAGGFHWCDEHKPFPSRPIDPSTIRDVTPPPMTPKENDHV